jgi:hypothetical protein
MATRLRVVNDEPKVLRAPAARDGLRHDPARRDDRTEALTTTESAAARPPRAAPSPARRGAAGA